MPMHAQTAAGTSPADLLRMIEDLKARQAQLEAVLKAAEAKLEKLQTSTPAPASGWAAAPTGPAAARPPSPPATAAVNTPNVRIDTGAGGGRVGGQGAGWGHVGGSWAAPLTERWGFQADALIGGTNKGTGLMGVGGHLFWRDPRQGAVGA